MKFSPQKNRSISLFGNFGSGNLGNDCTLKAALQNLCFYASNVTFSCICANPESVNRDFGIEAVHMHPKFIRDEFLQNSIFSRIVRKLFIGIPIELLRWGKLLLFLKNKHMVIFIGTQFLSDDLSILFGNSYIAFKWSVASKIMGCKLVYMSVGVGPLYRPLSRLFVHCALRLADYRSYRDISSKNYAMSIGLSRFSDPVYPDLAFSIRAPDIIREKTKNIDSTIAIGVINFKGQFGSNKAAIIKNFVYEKYLYEMLLVLVNLVKDNRKIRMVIGDKSCDPGVVNDLIFLLKVNTKNFDLKNIENQDIVSVDNLIECLNMADVVVSCRFHNIILGFVLNRPAISISYSKKFDDLMDDFGFSEYCINIEQINIIEFKTKIEKILRDSEILSQRIKNKVQENRRNLESQYNTVLHLLN